MRIIGAVAIAVVPLGVGIVIGMANGRVEHDTSWHPSAICRADLNAEGALFDRSIFGLQLESTQALDGDRIAARDTAATLVPAVSWKLPASCR